MEMLHGTPGAPSDIITGLDPIGAESRRGITPFIGVAPDGHGPALSEIAFADVSTQHLGTAISDDLRRYVDRHYRTNGDWNVAGLSSGGYGAAYLGSRKVGQYSSVCAMSGSFVPKGSEFAHQHAEVLRAATPLLNASRRGPRTLLLAGRADRVGMLEAHAYASALRKAGEPYRIRALTGGHTWSVWARALPMCLRYMLRPLAPARRAT